MNTGVPWPDLTEAEARVLAMQTKLHQWAVADAGRRFDDLYNLVHDPSFLVVAWSRVRGNKGARTAGIDGIAPRAVGSGAGKLLIGLREILKARKFTPTRVREKMIPKASGKVRRLGIPTATDRVVQASLKLVLEPIFEADFHPCSYGFRPKRRARDAIAEIHFLASPNRNYEWVFEADIEACFDAIDHTALMDRVRRRIRDKRLVGLVKAFLRAGILTEEGLDRQTITGTPQGGILSPLLANIALSVLDEHFACKWKGFGPDWKRIKHRRAGGAVMKLIRYADDCVPRGCTRDEGRPLEAGLQGQASNHHKLQGSRAPVVSVVGKGRKKTDQVRTKETSASEPLLTCRKHRDDVKTGWQSLTREESGGDLFTAQAASGIKAA